jgi:hypothetical protein
MLLSPSACLCAVQSSKRCRSPRLRFGLESVGRSSGNYVGRCVALRATLRRLIALAPHLALMMREIELESPLRSSRVVFRRQPRKLGPEPV